MADAVAAGDRLNVFISYSRLDLGFADQLRSALLSDFAVTIDRESITGGDNWEQRLGALIRDADTVVFALSPASARSDTCAWEVREAVRLGKRIIPIVCRSLEGAAPPPELTALQFILFYDEPKFPGSGFWTGLNKLRDALNTDPNWVREHTRYLRLATEWKEVNRPPDRRLLSAADIALAKEWASKRPTNAPEITALQREFIDASEAEDVRQAEEKAAEEVEKKQAALAIAAAKLEAAEADKRRLKAEKDAASAAAEAAKLKANEQAAEADRRRHQAVEADKLRDEAERKAALQATENEKLRLEAERNIALQAAEAEKLARLEAEREADRRRLEAAEADKGRLEAEQKAALEAAEANKRRLEAAEADKRRLEAEQKAALQTAETERARLKDAAKKKLLLFFVPATMIFAMLASAFLYSAYLANKFSEEAKLNLARSEINEKKAEQNLHDAQENAKYLERAEKNAEEQKKNAEAAKEKAQESQSRYMALLATQKREKGDAATAELLALEALPGGGVDVNRPYVPEAEVALDGAWRALRERSDLPLGSAGLSAAFSPDGKRVFTAASDGTSRIWDAKTGQLTGVPLNGRVGSVFSAAFSPDGKRIVTASDDRTAKIWDLSNGLPIGAPLQGHNDAVLSAAFSPPDGKLIVTASLDKTARIWDAATGRQISKLPGDEAFFDAAFSPDGKRVATASGGEVQIWDVATGDPMGGPLKGHEDAVNTVSFSRNGKLIVTASDDKTARVWEAATGQESGDPILGHDEAVLSAAFSPDPDGKLIVTASEDKTARVWDAKNRLQIEVLGGHQEFVQTAAFSPDGESIVTASDDGTARVWDVKPSHDRVLSRHKGPILSASFSRDGTRIVTASEDGTAQVLNAESGKLICELKGHSAGVTSAAFSLDGARIVTSSYDKTARIWNAATGEPIGEPLRHQGYVFGAAFDPDGKRIVTASGDKTARIWDAATGQQIGEPLSGHTEPVFNAAFDPEGKRIVTASEDGTVRVWDAATSEQTLRSFVSCADMNFEDGAAGSARCDNVDSELYDKTTHVLDREGGTPIYTLKNKLPQSAMSASFSPDGTRIVTASFDNTVGVWDAKTMHLIKTLIGHTKAVNSAVFSPDGTLIATASLDNTARIWNAETGALIRELDGHSDGVTSAAFSPDGKRVVTASNDKAARLWDVIPDRNALISDAKTTAPRCLTPRQRTAFYVDPAPPEWCVEMKKWPYDTSEWKQWLKDKRAGKNPQLPEGR